MVYITQKTISQNFLFNMLYTYNHSSIALCCPNLVVAEIRCRSGFVVASAAAYVHSLVVASADCDRILLGI